jgi:cold shock CspA family protein
VQGTVSAFDLATHDGRVLLDDGRELPFRGAALAGSGLRLLRTGQRVRLETIDDAGGIRVVAVQLLTLR